MDRAARFVKPMMLREPPALGSKAPGDLAALLREAGADGGLLQARDPRAGPRVHDVGRRPARRLLRARRAQGLDRVERRGRRLGRPAHAGHRLQPPPPRARRVRRDRGRLGPGDRRHGRDQPGDRRLGAQRAGAEILTGAEVASIDVRNGSAVGVTLADGTELRAPIVASGAHPKTTVLELTGAENFPAEIGEDMARYRTRGASVKVNLVLSEPPMLRGRHRGGAAADDDRRGQHLPLDRLPRARLAGRDPGQARRAPLRRGRAALRRRHHAHRRRPLGDDDVHPVRARRTRSDWKPGDRERYGDTCIEQLTQFAPNLKDAVLEREVLAPPDLERIFGLQGGSIFQGEQGLDQMAFMRPHPEMAQYATPVGGLYLCGAGTHPGGGVTGCSGHNAAHRILKDRKRARRPWRRARADGLAPRSVGRSRSSRRVEHDRRVPGDPGEVEDPAHALAGAEQQQPATALLQPPGGPDEQPRSRRSRRTRSRAGRSRRRRRRSIASVERLCAAAVEVAASSSPNTVTDRARPCGLAATLTQNSSPVE